MIPTLLITLREVIEAALIVATIIGMLTKLNQTNQIKTVWTATTCALALSFLFVFGGSILGMNMQKIYTPAAEKILYILSAVFITWTVFFLHNQIGLKKLHLSQGVFLLTLTAVLREGIEIALFLSTVYLTNTPFAILTGFVSGIILGIGISVLFFSATIHMSMHVAFRVISFLLILVAGNLLTHALPLYVGLTYIFLMHRWVFVRSR